MRALLTTVICLIICAPAWSQDNTGIHPFRYVEADEIGCTEVNHAFWDGCNCICELGRFWDTPTDYCQLESTMIPLWQAREMRGIENLPVEPRDCSQKPQEQELTQTIQGAMEYVENTFFDRDGDGWCPLGYDQDNDGCCLEHEFEGDVSDCDDSDPEVNPEAEEIMGDGIDNNCDGYIDGVPGEQPIVYDSDSELHDFRDPSEREDSVEDTVEGGDDLDELTDDLTLPQLEDVPAIPMVDLDSTSPNLINRVADATFEEFPPGELDQMTARGHGWQLIKLAADQVLIQQDVHSGNYLGLYPFRDDDQTHEPFISSLSIDNLPLTPGGTYELSFSYRTRTRDGLVVVLRDQEGSPVSAFTAIRPRKTRGNLWKRTAVRLIVADDTDLSQGTLSIGWGGRTEFMDLDNVNFELVSD